MTPALVALLACHDRREHTLRCLASLRAAAQGRNWLAVLADDGSRDGTAAAARALLGDHLVTLRGSGNWYWNHAMLIAWRWARQHHPAAPVLWLNDDVVLDPDTLDRLLAVAADGRTVVVGALRDPLSGLPTYGGVRQGSWLDPLAFRTLPIADAPQSCDSCNGNLVLVPARVAHDVGLLDPVFRHAMGDFDYGLRVRRRGFGLVQVAGSCGTCARNAPHGTWRDASLPRHRRLRLLHAVKGLPPRIWFTFAWRCGGPWGLLRSLSPWVRIALGR